LDKAKPKGGAPRRLARNSILYIVATLGRQAGLSQRLTADGLRHEAVNRLLALTNGNVTAAHKLARQLDARTTGTKEPPR
jgi:hypothetical protein